jgi:hypothetical protein
MLADGRAEGIKTLKAFLGVIIIIIIIIKLPN